MPSVRIESLAYGGDGIGRLDDGRTAFVRLACPGDLVEIEVVEDRPRFVRAKVTSIIEPGPGRVKPPCPYFGTCGGCQWQHVAYETQLAEKRTAVVESLSRIGGVRHSDLRVAQTVPSPQQYGYRNKIELVAERFDDGLRLGYHELASTRIVPVETCLLLPKKLLKAPKALSGALRYVSGANDLRISRVALRVAHHMQDVEVALWTNPGRFPRRAAASTLSAALPGATSLVRVLSKGADAARSASGVEVLSGNGFWRERLLGRTMTVSAPSFFQVNSPAAEKLVDAAVRSLEPDGTDKVLDVYAGAGTFTLPLAEVAGEVVSIEATSSALRDLRRNLEVAQLWADVVGGDAARELAAGGSADLALVDPPRAGLTEGALQALASTGVRTIVYVSCDPTTLARDTRELMLLGFELSSAAPFDLFPQTYHIETLAIFSACRD